jgi:hypothetical protein
MDNPEGLSTLSTQDRGQINIRENQGGDEEWTIQRHWQHCLVYSMLTVSLDFPLLIVPRFLLRLFVLCLAYSMLTVPLDCPFLIAPSVSFKVYLSCVLRTQCCQCLLIVHSSLPPRFSLMFICPMSCVLNVDSA